MHTRPVQWHQTRKKIPKTHSGYRKKNRHKSSTSKKKMNPVKQALMPAKEAEAMPAKEAEVIPAKEAEVIPAKEAEVIPAKEAEVIPAKEAEVMPAKAAEAISIQVCTQSAGQRVCARKKNTLSGNLPKQPKPRNTSMREAPKREAPKREAPKREAPKREAPKREGLTKPTEQRVSRRMTRSQRAQVLDKSAKVAAQNIQEDDPLTYEEAMTGLKKQS
jgi:hypothetical protein